VAVDPDPVSGNGGACHALFTARDRRPRTRSQRMVVTRAAAFMEVARVTLGTCWPVLLGDTAAATREPSGLSVTERHVKPASGYALWKLTRETCGSALMRA